MKTMIKYIRLLLITAALGSLTACEINISSDDYYTDRLCNTLWEDEWMDGNYRSYQKIIFYTDGTGRDRLQTWDNSYDLPFYWHWDRGNRRNIVISYGPGDVSHFDDVQVDWSTLSGYLDGTFVEFKSW